MIADSDSEVVSYLRDRVLFLLWRLLRSRVREAAAEKAASKAVRAAETPEQKRERLRVYQREYGRTHYAERSRSYVNPVDPELRRHDVRGRSFGAVNSPAQLEALAYRYFVCRFGSPARRHRHSAPPYNGSGGTFISRRRRDAVTVTATAVDPVTLHGRLTALDDMHYRTAITVARLEQTVQPS